MSFLDEHHVLTSVPALLRVGRGASRSQFLQSCRDREVLELDGKLANFGGCFVSIDQTSLRMGSECC